MYVWSITAPHPNYKIMMYLLIGAPSNFTSDYMYKLEKDDCMHVCILFLH